MKKLCLIFVSLSFLLYSEVKKATYDEIKNSICVLEEAIKAENENLVSLFSEAIEIEKRANSPYYAEKIMKKVCKTGKISLEQFKKLRENFSFFDISIAWAINQITGKSIEEILREKKESEWKNVFSDENIIQFEDILSKIKQLNPKSETF
ncbi:MAG: hypothetical protein NC917_04415 [Candidatus Omnitrophica bacterium]|nr:hypothetical protein [Candidatus Omnitrophota bacterium]MCM8810874.1 hypothetical protein [Candidatus Omnitrophota bacterium]